MTRVGSCDRTAEIAARALVDFGCTNLQVKIGCHVAGFGGSCWQTDRAVVEALAANGGHVYHRESVGRARRQLARMGILKSRRVFSGQRPCSRARPSAHGTTIKRIRWDRLGVVDPAARRDVAIDRAARAKKRRIEIAKQTESAGRARYSAPPAVYSTKPPAADGELAAVLDKFVQHQIERVARTASIAPIGQEMSDHGPGPPSRR